MMLLFLYILAIIALVVGTAAIYSALFKPFPLKWISGYFFIRKPVAGSIFVGTVIWVCWVTWRMEALPIWTLIPLAIMGLAVVLTYRIH